MKTQTKYPDMIGINLFVFRYHEHVLEFANPLEAIEYFDKYGYDMTNWSIKVDYTINGNSEITYKTFVYLTEVYQNINNIYTQFGTIDNPRVISNKEYLELEAPQFISQSPVDDFHNYTMIFLDNGIYYKTHNNLFT